MKLISSFEASRIIKCSAQNVRDLIKKGVFSHYRKGRCIYVVEKEVKAYAERYQYILNQEKRLAEYEQELDKREKALLTQIQKGDTYQLMAIRGVFDNYIDLLEHLPGFELETRPWCKLLIFYLCRGVPPREISRRLNVPTEEIDECIYDLNEAVKRLKQIIGVSE